MSRPQVRRAQALLALLACAGTALALADEPRQWLARMNDALTTRNYDGTFFHVREGKFETLRIVHRVKDGQVMERLQSLGAHVAKV